MPALGFTFVIMFAKLLMLILHAMVFRGSASGPICATCVCVETVNWFIWENLHNDQHDQWCWLWFYQSDKCSRYPFRDDHRTFLEQWPIYPRNIFCQPLQRFRTCARTSSLQVRLFWQANSVWHSTEYVSQFGWDMPWNLEVGSQVVRI